MAWTSLIVKRRVLSRVPTDTPPCGPPRVAMTQTPVPEPYSPSLSPASSPVSSHSSLPEYDEAGEIIPGSPAMAVIEDPTLSADAMQNKQLDTVKCQWEGCIREFASLKTLIEHLHTGTLWIYAQNHSFVELYAPKKTTSEPTSQITIASGPRAHAEGFLKHPGSPLYHTFDPTQAKNHSTAHGLVCPKSWRFVTINTRSRH